jgi:hypothetical protein
MFKFFNIARYFTRAVLKDAGTGFRPNAYVQKMDRSLDLFIKQSIKYGFNNEINKNLEKDSLSNQNTPSANKR